MPEVVATQINTPLVQPPAAGLIKAFLGVLENAKKTITKLPNLSEQDKIKCEQCWQQ